MSGDGVDRHDGPTPGVLLQMIQDNQKAIEEGHRRLRTDIMDLEAIAQRHDSTVGELRRDIDRIDRRPTDISTMVMSTKQVATIVICCVGIAGGIWSVRAEVQDLKAQVVVESQLRREQFEEVRKEIKAYETKTDAVEKALVAKGVIR